MPIYLVYQAWFDPLENHNAFGYSLYKIVATEKLAQELIKNTPKPRWIKDPYYELCSDGKPYMYFKIKECEVTKS